MGRRRFLGERLPQSARRRRLVGGNLGGDRAQPRRIGEEFLLHADHARVGEVAIAVGVRALLDFSEVVGGHHIAWRDLVEPDVLGEQSHLREHGSRGGSRCREDSRLAEPELQSRPHPRFVSRQIAARDQTADALLALLDLASQEAAVENRRRAPGSLERPTEVALLPESSGRGSGAVGKKDGSGFGIAREPAPLQRDRSMDDVGNREPVASEANRRLEEHFPGKLPGEPVRERQTGDRTGNPRRERSLGRGRRLAAGSGFEKEIPTRRPRGDLAEVDDQRAPARVSGDPEAAAPDVAGFGPGHGERERDRHRGIGCVSALFEDLDADPRGRFLRCGDPAPRAALDSRRPARGGRSENDREKGNAQLFHGSYSLNTRDDTRKFY